MALDPRISLGVQPMQMPDPLAQYGKIAAIQQAQNQNALAQYQLSAAQREEEKTNALSRAYQEAYNPKSGEIDVNRLRQSLATGGFGAQLPAVEKALGELETQKLTRQKTEGELVKQRMETSRELLSTVRTPEEYIAWHEANHADPVLGKYLAGRGITADQARAQIVQQLQQPGGFETLLRNSALGLEKSMKQHFVTQNLGGSTQVMAMPEYQVPGAPSKAAVVPGSVQQMTMAPGEAERIAISRSQLGVAQGQLDLARQKERRIADTGEGTELAPKEIRKREAAYPKATSAVKSFEANSDGFISDLKKLRDHPGLSNITGVIAGRTPSFTSEGRAAQALYDKIVAKGGFQALQALREASTTGGALGSVSNQEGKQLVQSFAAIDQRQDAPDVQAAIDQVIQEVEGTKSRVREAYDMTYDYKTRRGNDKVTPAQPGAPKPTVSNW